MQWARQYRNRFFEQVLPKAMAAKASDDDSEMVKRERKSIAEIERILDRMNQKIAAEMAEELAAGVPRPIYERIRAVVADWGRRHQVALSDDARRDLELHLGELVQRYATAAVPASGGE